MREQRHETREREASVLKLRIQGFTFDEIAQSLHLSGKSASHRIYRRALDATVREPADDLRRLEGSRIDRLQAEWWPRAVSGNYQAARIVIKLLERRAKLFGLDAPHRLHVNTADLDAQIAELLAELGSTLPMSTEG